MKNNSASKIKLTSFDELFGGVREAQSIQSISIYHLVEFKNHPFRVVDDEAMEELVESIKEYGIITPILIREKKCEEYEIISGHRRVHAAGIVGLEEVPAIICDISDCEAIKYMVYSNIQRPEILPSEKAFAYKMRLEAEKHQGSKGNNSAGSIGEENGESARQVQRYIRLTFLIPELLQNVDEKKIPFNVAVILSFLKTEEQELVQNLYRILKKYPSLKQASTLKKLSEEEGVSESDLQDLMVSSKAKKKDITLSQKNIQKYFDENYSVEAIEKVIFQLLDDWKSTKG